MTGKCYVLGRRPDALMPSRAVGCVTALETASVAVDYAYRYAEGVAVALRRPLHSTPLLGTTSLTM